jgi:hypothetical protein
VWKKNPNADVTNQTDLRGSKGGRPALLRLFSEPPLRDCPDSMMFTFSVEKRREVIMKTMIYDFMLVAILAFIATLTLDCGKNKPTEPRRYDVDAWGIPKFVSVNYIEA